MMKNKMTGLVIGGLITLSALGLTLGVNSIGKAAENDKSVSPSMMMQNGQMETMNSEMMNSSEMQNQCTDMMSKPEMQKTMKEMMKQPQMQSMMKQLMSSDPEFKQLMSDIVKDVDNENSSANEQLPPTAKAARN